jgi:hypothetical protein
MLSLVFTLSKSMTPPQEQSTTALAMSEEEQQKVRQQLRRLTDTPLFRNSRRYPVLLRFIVEETLEGRGDLLKERLIGIHVFDRPADYDTAADPVVRVTVAEIRKRIAQYYNDEEHDAEIRIELLPGRYAPEFRFRHSRRDHEPLHEPESATQEDLAQRRTPTTPLDPITLQLAPAGARPSRAPRPLLYAACALFVLTISVGLFFKYPRQTSIDRIWQPLLSSAGPILVCLPTGAGRKPGPADFATTAANAEAPGETFEAHQSLGENVVYSDMLATIKATDVLATHHRDFRIKLNTVTNLEDLRQGPAILIGGLDNQWTMQALSALRFRFAGQSDSRRFWIVDTRKPANTQWSLDLTRQYSAVTRDYAIIARIRNEETGEPQIIIAGIGMSGTAAAGEFLTNDRDARELRQRLGPNSDGHDFEVVLSTDVIDGIAGSPKIVDAYSW